MNNNTQCVGGLARVNQIFIAYVSMPGRNNRIIEYRKGVDILICANLSRFECRRRLCGIDRHILCNREAEIAR